MSRHEGFPTFWELTPSTSSACAGGLIESNLMTSCTTLLCVYVRSGGHAIECVVSARS